MPSDGDEFLASLSAKMDAVSGIKRQRDAEVRRYRTVALIAGLVIGAGMTAFL